MLKPNIFLPEFCHHSLPGKPNNRVDAIQNQPLPEFQPDLLPESDFQPVSNLEQATRLHLALSFLPFTNAVNCLKSSIRPLVQLPKNTKSTFFPAIFSPGA
jgi:hypothetical protein